MNFTLGADPEILLERIVGGHKIPTHLIGKIGGTKQEPKEFGLGHIQEDNVCIEFNIPPATSSPVFTKSIAMMVSDIHSLVSTYKVKVSNRASCKFPKVLMTAKALEFGCEPDYCAWKCDINPIPVPPDPLFRCAGGHIHVGWDYKTDKERVELARLLDVYCGIPSVLYDSDNERRQFYGKAGSHRPKEYGIEYRVLSNYWIFTKVYSNEVYRGVERALNNIKNVDTILTMCGGGPNIERIINTYDIDGAQELLSTLKTEGLY